MRTHLPFVLFLGAPRLPLSQHPVNDCVHGMHATHRHRELFFVLPAQISDRVLCVSGGGGGYVIKGCDIRECVIRGCVIRGYVIKGCAIRGCVIRG